jgi:hypothetical protein
MQDPHDQPYGLAVGSAGSDDGGRWLTKRELAAVRRISIGSADRLIRKQGWRRQPGNDGRVRALIPPDWLSPRYSEADSYDPTDQPPEPTADPTTGAASPTSDPTADPTVLAVLDALREAHAGEIERLTGAKDGEIARLTEALVRSEREIAAQRSRADILIARADGLRDQLTAVEAKRTEAEQGRAEAEHDRAEVDERATDAIERAAGLDSLLADAERRLTAAESARKSSQERIDALDRAEIARQGRGRWARLRAAWRGE